MSTDRLNPARGFCNPAALPKGPNGRNLCRKCSTECQRSRQTFCGPACVDAWRITTSPGYVRRLIWARDHGQCALCPTACTMRSVGRWSIPWDADHIVPVVEGGGECGLDNYRTLCRPCHVVVTRALRARLAAKKASP